MLTTHQQREVKKLKWSHQIKIPSSTYSGENPVTKKLW